MAAQAPQGDDLSAPGTVAENEPPPPTEYASGIDGGAFIGGIGATEYASGIDGGAFIGGLAGLGFDFDGNGEKACFPCFLTLTCYRACLSGVLEGLNEGSGAADDSAAGILAGVILDSVFSVCTQSIVPTG